MQTEPVVDFDSRLWASMVDYVTVGVDKGMTVVFRDGTEVRDCKEKVFEKAPIKIGK